VDRQKAVGVTAGHFARRPAGLSPSGRASPLAAVLDACLTEVAARPFPGARRWWVISRGGGIELRTAWAPHLPAPVLRAMAGQALQRLFCTASALGVTAGVLAGPQELGADPRAAAAGIGLTEQVLVRVGPPDEAGGAEQGPLPGV
jgi:hypothetical protein